MVNVIFIELPVPDKIRYSCQIVEKFYTAGNRILIYINDEDEASQLDRALWTWKEDTFIPHVFSNNPDTFPDDPVLITTLQQNKSSFNTLILYDPLPINQIEAYGNIIDFAETFDNKKLHDSRDRYKAMRDKDGYVVSFQKLGSFMNLKVD